MGQQKHKAALISIHAPRVGSDTTAFNSFKTEVISIHAPRVGSDGQVPGHGHQGRNISIHAPRVGSDNSIQRSVRKDALISIHAPRVGSDRKSLYGKIRTHTFQSTLPVWGATSFGPACLQNFFYFNPRSPCGERPGKYILQLPGFRFQSTLPVWGATIISKYLEGRDGISIHAPRVGSDLF